jgi:putative tricarboxylic transport membrane protein
VYLPFARNFELVDAVMGSKAAAGVSGYGTFRAELAGGKLRALGVSSKKPLRRASVREQGLDVDLTNWRAVFTGAGRAGRAPGRNGGGREGLAGL